MLQVEFHTCTGKLGILRTGSLICKYLAVGSLQQFATLAKLCILDMITYHANI